MHEEADMRRRVRELISDLAPVRGGGEVDALTHLVGELGYDSLRLMELTGVLESEFDMACADERELLAIENVADVEALVRRLAAGRGPANAPRDGRELNNFGAALAGWAATEPDSTALTFLHDDRDAETLTYGRLHGRATGLAKVIAESVRPGERVMILLPPGVDLVAAMFACFYAGVVAVAAPPPNLLKPHRSLPRLEAIAADADVAAVITEDGLRRRIAGAAGSSLRFATWLAPDADPAPGWQPQMGGLDEPLLLQYTSGSTARPRGVVLTSRNLIANSAAIAAAFGHTRDSRMFSWLPPYHDMGLIGGIFQPLFVGFPTVLASPFSILKRPGRWLEGISESRATTSGGPNFAYDLCVHRIPAATRDRLDLSSWTVAFNGAEPVLAETIDRFTATFAAGGFRREAFLPCYGLAEATLMVSAAEPATAPVTFEIDADDLGEGRVSPTAAGPGGRTLVSSGIPAPEFDVHIIDPVTRAPAEPGRVGEIWIAGDSVASGYWRRGEDSEAVFGARILGDPERAPYLRSGDLGVLIEGQLVVVGRLKDVIIVRGVNYHAHDLELAAESAHPAVRKHCSAAFQLEDGREGLGVVCEVDPGIGDDLGAVCARIRRTVAEEIGVRPVFAGLIAPGAMPKTASGKVQRLLCRRLLRTGALTVLAESRDRQG
ncbi:AMP-binding protein [Nocardia mexicana]|uniref:Acyl-CoA synthetase (AMP-forming)/AMP-acid ligase II n=1 Tax=Nocardia mexicana TaxID=279262 RepID=A0A370HEC4_9NOCA|nr:AMP-binding protein [Nocardia mexicana]RDI55573.1 acyl-CoA synthetase (AMP-forming)/AMP-acid ligase II [Nocardia mexicana]